MTSSPYLRTPLTLRWKISPSPNVPSSWNSPYNHSSLLDWPINTSKCPIMALPVVPQLTPTAPTVVSQPSLNDIAITPIIPTDQLFPPCLWAQRWFHLGEDITVVGRGTWFFRVEARDLSQFCCCCCWQKQCTALLDQIWEGLWCWLQLAHCTYLILLSEYFRCVPGTLRIPEVSEMVWEFRSNLELEHSPEREDHRGQVWS